MLHIGVLILAPLPDVFKFYSRNEDIGAEIEQRSFRARRLLERGRKPQGREGSFL